MGYQSISIRYSYVRQVTAIKQVSKEARKDSEVSCHGILFIVVRPLHRSIKASMYVVSLQLLGIWTIIFVIVAAYIQYLVFGFLSGQSRSNI
jgi:hypothetical protein